jgi:hypothetical protein
LCTRVFVCHYVRAPTCVLSRVEKRAAVVRYASVLVLRLPLNCDVIVDTVCVRACEQEALLEAPSLEPRRAKPRVPFMQKGMCCG